jgi:hypothetical protein
MRIQFDLPSEYSQRLLKFPPFPNWRGRENFYIQIFVEYINSPEFRMKELEHENRAIRRDRDQKAKDAEFWKEKAGGFLSLFRKQSAASQADPVQDETGAA